jgi:UDP-N-acetylglucosamine acyltransferase
MTAATHIHPSAVVAPGAELDSGVQVGPYTVIGPHVRIGRGTQVGSHAVIEGQTTIGRQNHIFQFASVGAIPQDKKYAGEDSRLIIGDHNTVREFATLQPGTTGGGMVTRVGDHNLFMVYSHVAHDCTLGSHIVMANSANLGGHVTIEDFAVVGALVGIHQFARIGESAILGAGAMVSLDVPPYCMAQGDRAYLFGLNLIGLKRRGFATARLEILKKAYRTLFTEGEPFRQALARVGQEYGSCPEVAHLVEFISHSQRGVCRPRSGVSADTDEASG